MEFALQLLGVILLYVLGVMAIIACGLAVYGLGLSMYLKTRDIKSLEQLNREYAISLIEREKGSMSTPTTYTKP